MGAVLPKAATLRRDMILPSAGVGGVSLRLARAAQKITSWTTASLGAVAPWNRMSRDGFSWDSGQSFIKDTRGSWIGVVIDNTNPSAKWAFSNDGGLTFSVSGAIDGDFLARASLAYDTVHDQIYALWEGTNNTDGVFLRRYAITRSTPGDATTTIASIATARDTALNLVMDAFTTTGTATYHSPQLVWLADNPAWTHGALLAVWSVGQTGSTVNGGEVRASMRALSNSAADNTASNWTAPTGAGTATITQTPTAGLGWSKIFGTTSVGTTIATDGDPFGVSKRLTAGALANGLAVAYFDAGLDAYRLATLAWRGTPNWDFAGSLTRTTLVAHRIQTVDASDAGYNSKQELTSQISHNASADRLYVGAATWTGDNASGDQWTLVEIDLANANAIATATVYQATKANCQATSFVTGAAYYDATADATLTTYTDLVNKASFSRTYNRTVPAAAAVALYSTTPVDIPCILPWRDVNGNAVVLFRDFNAAAVATPPTAPTYTAPYQGFVARGTYS